MRFAIVDINRINQQKSTRRRVLDGDYSACLRHDAETDRGPITEQGTYEVIVR